MKVFLKRSEKIEGNEIKFKIHMINRKLLIKGLSKPIQLKLEVFLDKFNIKILILYFMI